MMKIVLLVTFTVGLAASVSLADPPSTQQLLDRIDNQQTEINQLKAELHQLREQSPQALSRTIQQVRDDAARGSQLVDLETFTAGYRADRGFMLQSDSGDFLLHPWLLFQFRNETTYRENGMPNRRSDTQNGFELRRLKFGLDGNLFGPRLTYQFIGSVDRHTGNVALEDAWAKYQLSATPFYIRAGQIRDPLDHEQILFAPFLLTVERSLADSIFASSDAIVQGVSIGFDNNGPIRAECAITDGLRSANTNFQDFPATGIPADWGTAGRVEWKIMGDWKQYSAITALNAKQQLLVFGAGADYTESGVTRQLTHVVDGQYDAPSGLSVYAAYLGRYVARDGGLPGTNGGFTGTKAAPNTYDSTVRAEAGYLVDRHWEPFVRYEFIHFDHAEAITGRHNINEFTAGLNYYLHGQRAKLTVDASYLPEGSPLTDDGSGVLPEPRGNEFIVRAQFQLIL